MNTRLIGFVLRASVKHETILFYETLGLGAREHQHGGPLHVELTPVSEDFVVEMYQASRAFVKDALMIAVDSLSDTLLRLYEIHNIRPTTERVDTKDMSFLYVQDPDGRAVMLVEYVK